MGYSSLCGVPFINLDCTNFTIFLSLYYITFVTEFSSCSTEELCILEYLSQLYWAHIHCTILQTFTFVTFQFSGKIAGIILCCSISHSLMAFPIQTGGVCIHLRTKRRKYSEIFKDFSFAVLTFLISERQFEHSSWGLIIKELYVLIYICLCNAHTITNVVF